MHACEQRARGGLRGPYSETFAPQALALNVECWARFDLCQVLPDIPEGLTSLSLCDDPYAADRSSETLELLSAAPFRLARLELIEFLPSTLGPIPGPLCSSLTELVLHNSITVVLKSALQALSRLCRLEVVGVELPAALPPSLAHAELTQKSVHPSWLVDGRWRSTLAVVAQLCVGMPSCTGLQSRVLDAELAGLDINKLLSRLPPNLTRLHLHYIVDALHLARVPQVQELHVRLAAAGSGTAMLPTALTRMQTWGSYNRILSALPALVRLRHLELCSPEYGDRWPATLAPSLTHLHLNAAGLRDGEPLPLILSGCAALEEVHVSVEMIHTVILEVVNRPVVAGLAALTRLRCLDMQDIVAPDLPAALPHLRTLACLQLQHCKLAGDGEEPPVLDVGPLQGMRELQLWGCDGVSRLPLALTRLELLTKLDFFSNAPLGQLQNQLRVWMRTMFGFDVGEEGIQSWSINLCAQ